MNPLNADPHSVGDGLRLFAIQPDLVEDFPVAGVRVLHELPDGLNLDPVKGLLLNIRPAMLLITILLAVTLFSGFLTFTGRIFSLFGFFA